MATFCYVKAHDTLINLDNSVSIANSNGAGVVVTMPDGKQYTIAMPLEKLIEFLHVPFMGNKVCIAINEEELKRSTNAPVSIRDIISRHSPEPVNAAQ